MHFLGFEEPTSGVLALIERKLWEGGHIHLFCNDRLISFESEMKTSMNSPPHRTNARLKPVVARVLNLLIALDKIVQFCDEYVYCA